MNRIYVHVTNVLIPIEANILHHSVSPEVRIMNLLAVWGFFFFYPDITAGVRRIQYEIKWDIKKNHMLCL